MLERITEALLDRSAVIVSHVRGYRRGYSLGGNISVNRFLRIIRSLWSQDNLTQLTRERYQQNITNQTVIPSSDIITTVKSTVFG